MMMVLRRRRSRPIFAPRNRTVWRALTFVLFVVTAAVVVGALWWTVVRLSGESDTSDTTDDHDHPPVDVPSAP